MTGRAARGFAMVAASYLLIGLAAGILVVVRGEQDLDSGPPV